jgi:DNA-binding transcriptional MerR regulator
MNKDNQEFVNSLLQRLAKLNYIKPGDVPNIDLYMDQVTTFMDEHLSDVKRYEDDKILTKTMINNYTKNDLLPPPVKKKYSKEHIYVLTFIYYLKNILSISDIQKLLNPLTDKFFNKEELPDLEYIYSEIYNMEKAQIASLSKDVVERTQVAKEAFLDVENEEDKDFLQLFSLVGLLSFDVYMKKNIIESLIDDYTNKADVLSSGKGNVKEDKKEVKKRTKNS